MQRHRKRLILFAILAALFVIVIAALPFGIQAALISWFEGDKAHTASIENVDFNPFSGALVIEGLDVREADGKRLALRRLSLDLELLKLFRQRVHLRTLTLEGGSLELLQPDKGPLRLAGLPQRKQAAPARGGKTNWRFGTDDIKVDGTRIRFHGRRGDETFALKDVRINNMSQWASRTPATVAAQIGVHEGSIGIAGKALPFTKTPSATATLTVKSLDLARLEKFFLDPKYAEIGGALSGKLDLKATFAPDPKGAGATSLAATGTAALDKLQLTTPDASLRNDEVRWTGTLSARLDGAGNFDAAAKGKFDSRSLHLDLPASALKVGQKSALWDGEIVLRQRADSAGPTLDFKGAAESRDVRIDSPELGMRLLRLGSLRLDGAKANGVDEIRVERLTAESLQTIQRLIPDPKKPRGAKPYIAFQGAVTGKGLAILNGTQMRLDQLLLNGADLQIERLENGELRLVGSLLKRIGQWTAAAKKRKSEDTAAVRVQIGKWSVTGNSRLALADRSVKPAAKFVVSPVRIDLTNIDTAEPDRNVPITVSAKLGKYSALDAKGTIRPFSQRLNLDITGKLTGFDLTSVTGYARRYMGYDLTQGRLDTEAHARVIDGKLQTESKLTISKLEVQTVEPKIMKPLDDRLEVPLETGLALLRDSEDVIRLSIPVTGDVANPEFDFSDAVNTAIGNAIKNTILTTLKVAFPLGGIIMAVAESGGKAGLQLAPLPFAAGSAELNAAAKASLVKLAQLLKSRPTVKISICGWAVPADRAKLDGSEKPSTEPLKDAEKTALLQLGKQRATAVKDHLIKQHGIAEPRLFLCAPSIGTGTGKEAGAAPRVELRL